MFQLVKFLIIAGFLAVITCIQPYTAATLDKTTPLPQGAIQVFPDKIVWKDAPSSVPAGARMAVLEGDPKKKAMFTMRISLPPHYQLKPHWHPRNERVTVLQGSVHVGFGTVMDQAASTELSAGCFYVNPAKAAHYIWTGEGPAVLQITGLGPWEVHAIGDKI